MNYQKNIEGLLRSFKLFNKKHSDTCLYLVGPASNEVLVFANGLGLRENAIHFTGSISYEEVATWLKRSHALVLFSRFENLPCVILEALCCGVPVVSTNVGGIAEVVNETNGILINSEDEEQLCEALNKIYSNYISYNKRKIAKDASESFGYETVGQQVRNIYEELRS